MDPKLEASEMSKGQAEVMNHIAWFTHLMALKCAVDLRLASIIHSHDAPISLSHLASITEPTTNHHHLTRIMRVLVHNNIFTVHRPSVDGGDPLYGPTPASTYLLPEFEHNLIAHVAFWADPVHMAPYRHLAESVRDGGVAFNKAYGMDVWDFMSLNPQYNSSVCTTKIEMRAFLEAYGDGFEGVGTLVDVGGNTGWVLGDIVKANPRVKGINFDLPYVVAAAPEREGVTHVAGDAFEFVPAADVVLMKRILHDWNDEDCIKILKKCRASIPEKTGKVVIVDIVLAPYDDDDLFAETALVFDIGMMAVTTGGKERTEDEWKKILALGGFPRYKVTKMKALSSIIEAFPN